jgi:predicted dinucleotide-binding enzyme
MKIAIVGAGKVGSALGTGWARAGHQITFGVRDRGKAELQALCRRIGAEATTGTDAARMAEIVVLALPWTSAEAAVRALGDLAGRIVMDCMNPLVFKDGVVGLDRGYSTSGAEAVQGWLPGARIVKAFNQVGTEMMTEGARFATPPAMFLAGDDAGAKQTVAGLVTDLRFEPLDAGDLAKSRLLEPLAMVWINQAMFRGLGRNWAFGVLRPTA